MQNHTLLGSMQCKSKTGRSVDPRSRKISADSRCAFSLTELLVSISIVGILLAITFPAAQAVRQAARRAHCLSNLKQVMMATLTYESKGTGFPPADDGHGKGFMVALLPFFEENQLSERAKSNWLAGESSTQRWAELSDSQITSFHCPASNPDELKSTLPGQGEYTTHYYGLAGPVGVSDDPVNGRSYSYKQLANETHGPIALQGFFAPRKNGKFGSRKLKDVTDGISTTFGLGEISRFEVADADVQTPQRSGWAFGAGYESANRLTKLYTIKSLNRPINSNGDTVNDIPFGSNHPNGSQFAMLDGSVHFVDATISLDILKMFSSINEHEKVNGLAEF